MFDNQYDVDTTESELDSVDAGVALATEPALKRPADSPHRYRAFRSNPINLLDPLGLEATSGPTTRPTDPVQDKKDAVNKKVNCRRWAMNHPQIGRDIDIASAVDAGILPKDAKNDDAFKDKDTFNTTALRFTLK